MNKKISAVKEKIITIIKKCAWVLLNPRLLLCAGLAWFITNGWCYVAIALGRLLKINWLFGAGAAYAAILWFPFTPEKIITVIIALWFLKLFFPNDTRTLKVLTEKRASLMAALRKRFKRKQETEE